jgi:activating signal cointegrator complex subunit 2
LTHSFSDDAQTLLRDRAYIDQMKADILRRAQEMELEDAEDDEEFEAQFATTVTSGSGQGKEAIPGDEVELDHLRRVKIAGDGESDNEGEESTDEEDEKPPSVEVILELAYIRDPKLFDRDSATRRSKSRAELKAQTGECAGCKSAHIANPIIRLGRRTVGRLENHVGT